MDLLDLPADSMAGFRFHGWLVVEVFTDAGHVGIGNAAFAPRLTKDTVDLYLKPLVIGVPGAFVESSALLQESIPPLRFGRAEFIQ